MQVGLIPSKRSCTYCKRELNLVAENRQDHKTPVVYRCYNRCCEKYASTYLYEMVQYLQLATCQ